MQDAVAASQSRELAAYPEDYVRFIILGSARTGSNMLVQALNSSPHLKCFREIFNWQLDYVDFYLDGYDKFDAQDAALRERDPMRFLHERIFCQQPEEIHAVGFKFQYGHVWGFPALLERLAQDAELHVLHLKRRNLLLQLLSLKRAQTTGVWFERRRLRPALARALTASRHPLQAARKLSTLLRRRKPGRLAPSMRMAVSVQELLNFISRTEIAGRHFESQFRKHPTLALFYEDMIVQRDSVYKRTQLFLGVEPRSLTTTLRRQNPEPLRELLANYDELYDTFRHTPHAWMFE